MKIVFEKSLDSENSSGLEDLGNEFGVNLVN